MKKKESKELLIAFRLSKKEVKKIDDAVDKLSRLNKRKFTRSDIFRHAINNYIDVIYEQD